MSNTIKEKKVIKSKSKSTLLKLGLKKNLAKKPKIGRPKTKKKMGRDKLEFSKEDLVLIRRLAEKGVTKAKIAEDMECSVSTLRSNALTNEAWKMGKEDIRSKVKTSYHALASKEDMKNWPAMKHFLACECDMSEANVHVVKTEQMPNDEKAELDLSKLTPEELETMLELTKKAKREEKIIA